FVSMSGTGLSGPSASTTAHLLLGPDACTIVAARGLTGVIGSASPVLVEPADGSTPWEVERLDGASGSRIGRGSVSIDCGTLERSVELASYLRPPGRWYGE